MFYVREAYPLGVRRMAGHLWTMPRWASKRMLEPGWQAVRVPCAWNLGYLARRAKTMALCCLVVTCITSSAQEKRA